MFAPGFARAALLPAVQELLTAVRAMGDRLDREFVELLQEQAREPQLPAWFLDAMVEHTLRMPVPVCRALLEGTVAFDVRRRLSEVRAPALLLWGEQDAIVSRDQQELLSRGLPGAELRVPGDCGHTPHWHDPRRFARDLGRFAYDVFAR